MKVQVHHSLSYLVFGLLFATTGVSLAQVTQEVIPAFDMTVRFTPSDPLESPRCATAIGANFGECDLLLELPDGTKWLIGLDVDEDGAGNQVEMEISDLSLPFHPVKNSPQRIFFHEFVRSPGGEPQKVLQLSKGSVEVEIRRTKPQPTAAAGTGAAN